MGIFRPVFQNLNKQKNDKKKMGRLDKAGF
jgi:hypothetical protein